ncbi:MAG: aldose 1-epimerase family protein [Lachnospiraceae bacterium]|nr:aldose 1-epimerase family protein [Lachnospiraceae bacterium]
MALYTLENGDIRIKVDSYGAELRSLVDVKTEREYMWCGDAAYWGRISPILFPVVGSYRNGESRYRGKVYKLPQHGFARDMEFMLTEQTKEEIWFCLTDKENTWENYPFAFSLELGYRLAGRRVEVMWRVSNPAEDNLYFSIGGHPAFAVPKREPDKINGYIAFGGVESITVRKIKDGLAVDALKEIGLEPGGILPVTEETFAEDALVVEDGQTGRVQLLDEKKKPFVTVDFDAPLFGVWTPSDKNAPFICIEPWYGRCDREDFTGSLKEREWGNALAAGESFEASYTIMI